MKTQKQKSEQKTLNLPQPQKHIGKFMRKAILVSTLAMSIPSLHAQDLKQILFQKDSANSKFVYSLYLNNKNEAHQTPDILEFLGEFEGAISKYSYKEIKLIDQVTLSIADQKAIANSAWFENDKYVFFYVSPKYMDGIKVIPGWLDVFKKIPPKSNASSEEKE